MKNDQNTREIDMGKFVSEIVHRDLYCLKQIIQWNELKKRKDTRMFIETISMKRHLKGYANEWINERKYTFLSLAPRYRWLGYSDDGKKKS